MNGDLGGGRSSTWFSLDLDERLQAPRGGRPRARAHPLGDDQRRGGDGCDSRLLGARCPPRGHPCEALAVESPEDRLDRAARRVWIVPQSWCVAPVQRSKAKVNSKVLAFGKFGGRVFSEDRTVSEMWLNLKDSTLPVAARTQGAGGPFH